MENLAKLYPIQYVASITKVKPHTLRAWEKRYGAVIPDRIDGQKRFYSQEQVDKLILIAKLVNHGNCVSNVANLPVEELESMLKTYGDESTNLSSKQGLDFFIEMRQNLLMALSHFKLDIISHELEKVEKNLNVKSFAFDVLLPLLQEVGKKVASGELSIAKEHALSSILKFHIGKILFSSKTAEFAINKTVVIAAPEGEQHEFGIMVAALLCAHYGMKWYYLAADLPLDALSEAAHEVKADLVILGISAYNSQNLSMIERYASKLLLDLPASTKIWIGTNSKTSLFFKQERIELIPHLEALDQKLSQIISH